MPNGPTDKIEERFVSAAFAGNPALKALAPGEAQMLANRMFNAAPGSKEIDGAMRQRGLIAMNTRGRAFTPFSAASRGARHVVVIPYVSPDPKANLVGSVGISDDEPASGIIVELNNNRVVQIFTFDFIRGQLVVRTISPEELLKSGPDKFVEDWERSVREPNLPIYVASGIATESFKGLMIDEYSSMIYSADDVRQLTFNAPLVSAIAELQHMRHLGVPSADSCCCCCTCSWGSCSSCSATATTYVNRNYYSTGLPE
jgi:hypothetical protein